MLSYNLRFRERGVCWGCDLPPRATPSKGERRHRELLRERATFYLAANLEEKKDINIHSNSTAFSKLKF